MESWIKVDKNSGKGNGEVQITVEPLSNMNVPRQSKLDITTASGLKVSLLIQQLIKNIEQMKVINITLGTQENYIDCVDQLNKPSDIAFTTFSLDVETIPLTIKVDGKDVQESSELINLLKDEQAVVIHMLCYVKWDLSSTASRYAIHTIGFVRKEEEMLNIVTIPIVSFEGKRVSVFANVDMNLTTQGDVNTFTIVKL